MLQGHFIVAMRLLSAFLITTAVLQLVCDVFILTFFGGLNNLLYCKGSGGFSG